MTLWLCSTAPSIGVQSTHVSQHLSFGQHWFESSHHIISITHLFSLFLPFLYSLFFLSFLVHLFFHPLSFFPPLSLLPIFSSCFSVLAIISSFLPLFPSSPLTTVSFLCWVLCSSNPVGGAVDREEGGAQRERCRGGWGWWAAAGRFCVWGNYGGRRAIRQLRCARPRRQGGPLNQA